MSYSSAERPSSGGDDEAVISQVRDFAAAALDMVSHVVADTHAWRPRVHDALAPRDSAIAQLTLSGDDAACSFRMSCK